MNQLVQKGDSLNNSNNKFLSQNSNEVFHNLYNSKPTILLLIFLSVTSGEYRQRSAHARAAFFELTRPKLVTKLHNAQF